MCAHAARKPRGCSNPLRTESPSPKDTRSPRPTVLASNPTYKPARPICSGRPAATTRAVSGARGATSIASQTGAVLAVTIR